MFESVPDLTSRMLYSASLKETSAVKNYLDVPILHF